MNSPGLVDVLSARLYLRLACLLTASAFFSPAYGQNIVTNGSFGPGFSLEHWQLDGGHIGWHTGPPGYLGLYFEGNLSQTLNTVAGQRYLLTFTTAHSRDPFLISTLQTFWGGRLVASYTFSEFGLTEQPRFLVTANGAATTLRFNASLLTGLDDVSVVPVPATQPEILLTSPTNGATYTMGDSIALRPEVTPGVGRSVGRVDFFYNGFNLIASVSNAPYSATWTNVPPGVWYLSARVTDSANEMTTASAAQVNVATRPTVVWSSPEPDAIVAIGDNVPLSARVLYNIGTGTITRLVFRAGSNVVQEIQGREFQGRVGNGLYTAVWTNAPEGEFTVSATGYNPAGAILSVAEAQLFVLPPAVLDQSQRASGSYVDVTPTVHYGQTFTPSIHGELHHIDINYFPSYYKETNLPVTVTVVETVNGQPIGRVLGQTIIPKADQGLSAKGAFFRSNRPVLRAGQLYAFIISSPLHLLGLDVQTSFEGDQYERGGLWRKAGDGAWEEARGLVTSNPDMVFATYMIPKNLAPIANAGPDRILECRDGTAGIQLDGSSSFDPEGGTLTFRWFRGESLISAGAMARVEVPFGTNEFTLVVTDSVGLTSTDSVQVIVRDTLPPRFRNATATPAILWPPNHRMVPVQLEVDVRDTCDSAPRFQIVNVTSNDPRSSDNDWEITGPLSLKLRAERSGSFGGRVYTVTIAAADVSGNASQHAVQVSVPLNRGDTRLPKPRLTRHATGAVSLDFETVPGDVYRVESSVDLVDWMPISPWLTATEERHSCLDQDAATAPRRFYRVVVRE